MIYVNIFISNYFLSKNFENKLRNTSVLTVRKYNFPQILLQDKTSEWFFLSYNKADQSFRKACTKRLIRNFIGETVNSKKFLR